MPVLTNARHEKFALGVISGLDGQHAWLAVAPQTSPAAAKVTASRLLTHANIQARIAELQAPALKRAEITAQRIIERAWEIASSDARDRVPALAVAARAFPEFRDGPVIDQSQHLHVEGLTIEELRRLASGS